MTRLLAIFLAALNASAEVITWDASPSTDATGYKVYASTTSTNGPWAFLGATSGLALTNATPGYFWYYVTATNACCESAPSVIAHRPGSPPKVNVTK